MAVPNLLSRGAKEEGQRHSSDFQDERRDDDSPPPVEQGLVGGPHGDEDLEVLQNDGCLDEKDAWAVENFSDVQPLQHISVDRLIL
jgi:hypothetical protein